MIVSCYSLLEQTLKCENIFIFSNSLSPYKAIACALKPDALKRKKIDVKDRSSHVPLEIGIRSVLSSLVR